MDNLKVISIRMSEEELQAIDKALQPFTYFKRSDFIRAAVKVLLSANLLEDCDNPVAENRSIIHNALYEPFGRFDGMNVHLKIEHYDKRTKGHQK